MVVDSGDTEDVSTTAEDDDLDSCVSVQSFSNEKNAKMCFFCEKIRIQRKGRQVFCRQIKNKTQFLNKIKIYATELGDISMLNKIEEETKNVNDSCLTYHNNCSLQYFARYQNHVSRPSTDEWATKRLLQICAREIDPFYRSRDH